eukprot:scaffold932_cov207-Alexandrium_tamarense.AAC.9
MAHTQCTHNSSAIATIEISSPSNGKHATMATSRLPQETVDYLKAWMMSTQHINRPYRTGEGQDHGQDRH